MPAERLVIPRRIRGRTFVVLRSVIGLVSLRHGVLDTTVGWPSASERSEANERRRRDVSEWYRDECDRLRRDLVALAQRNGNARQDVREIVSDSVTREVYLLRRRTSRKAVVRELPASAHR